MMAPEYSKVPPIPHVPAHTEYIEAGVLIIGVEYRIHTPERYRQHRKSLIQSRVIRFLKYSVASPLWHCLKSLVASRQGDAGGPRGNRDDDGVSIHVFAREEGKLNEYFRIDCFGRRPHYHYLYPRTGGQIRLLLDSVLEPDAEAWAFEKLEDRLPEILEHAGAGGLARRVRPEDIKAVAPRIRSAIRKARDAGRGMTPDLPLSVRSSEGAAEGAGVPT